MPSDLTVADFLPYVGQTFCVDVAGAAPIELELVAATELSPASRPNPESRQPFSLLFLGPPSDHYLSQRTYRLAHAQMGDLDIFLVPLGPVDRRMQYEAIFT
jgi:hypothetical protein